MNNNSIMRKASGYYSHYMKKDRFFWIFSIVFISMLLFILTPPILGSAFRNLKVGDKAPSFALKDLDGNEVKNEDFEGKYFLFCYFQIDKDKSKNALKSINAIQKNFKGKDIAFVGITSNMDMLEDIKKFRDENNIEFPILLDEKKDMYNSFGIFVMPVTGLVGKDSTIIYEYSSHMTGFDSEVEGRIKVALGEITEEEYKKTNTRTVIKERTSEEKSALKKLGHAELLLARGKPAESLVLLTEVVALDPDNVKAHLLLGDSLLKKARLDDAMEEYKKVKELAKKNSPYAKSASIGMGAIFALQGELDKAKKILSIAAMINPNPIAAAKAYYWLGFIEERKENLKGAVKNYKKAVEKLLSKSKRGR